MNTFILLYVNISNRSTDEWIINIGHPFLKERLNNARCFEWGVEVDVSSGSVLAHNFLILFIHVTCGFMKFEKQSIKKYVFDTNSFAVFCICILNVGIIFSSLICSKSV